MEERSARIRTVTELADGVFAVDFEAVSPTSVQTRAGQFVSLSVGAGQRRSYSVTSAPDRADGFEVLIRDRGAGATHEFLEQAKAGDSVRYFGPMGFFQYAGPHQGDVVFAATGVGISAIWSMLQAALAAPADHALHLYWGMRNRAELFWTDTLERWADQHKRFRYQLCLSDEGGDRITEPVLATADTLDSPTYYLCGNGGMVAEITAGLVERGVDAERVRSEAFHPPVAQTFIAPFPGPETVR